MSDSNHITVRGHVGTDPDVVITPNGREITKFRLGSTRSYRDASGEWHGTETEWFTVKTWGPGGQGVRRSVRKGMPVIVQGVFSSEEWTSGERQGHTKIITAGAIGVDVKHGLVTFARLARQQPADASPASAEEGEEPAPEEVLAEAGEADGFPAEGAEADPSLAEIEDPWQKAVIEAG